MLELLWWSVVIISGTQQGELCHSIAIGPSLLWWWSDQLSGRLTEMCPPSWAWLMLPPCYAWHPTGWRPPSFERLAFTLIVPPTHPAAPPGWWSSSSGRKWIMCHQTNPQVHYWTVWCPVSPQSPQEDWNDERDNTIIIYTNIIIISILINITIIMLYSRNRTTPWQGDLLCGRTLRVRHICYPHHHSYHHDHHHVHHVMLCSK